MFVPDLLRRCAIALSAAVLTLAVAPFAPASAVPPERFTFDDTNVAIFVNCGESVRAVVHEWGNGLIRFQATPRSPTTATAPSRSLRAGSSTSATTPPTERSGCARSARTPDLFVIDLNDTPDNFDDDVEVSSEFLSFSGRDDRETTDFCDWFLEVTA